MMIHAIQHFRILGTDSLEAAGGPVAVNTSEVVQYPQLLRHTPFSSDSVPVTKHLQMAFKCN